MNEADQFPYSRDMNISWRESRLANEHRGISPNQLYNVVLDYVRAINMRAMTESEFQELARTCSTWPGIIGKEEKFDDTGIREFARKNLVPPRLTPAKSTNRTAPWAEEPARNIVDILNKGGRIKKNDPCGIIWAADSFVDRDEDAEGRQFAFCSLSGKYSPPPIKSSLKVPSVAKEGDQIWVRRDHLHLIADVVTCLYGPEARRVSVYAERMAGFIRELSPNCGYTIPKLFREIKKELTKKLKSWEEKPEVMAILSLDFLKDEGLQKSVQKIWHYAPLHLEKLPVRKPDRKRSGARMTYDLPGFEKENPRWFDDVQRPLIKAVLNEIPHAIALSKSMNASQYVNSSDVKPGDLFRSLYRQPKPGLKKK